MPQEMRVDLAGRPSGSAFNAEETSAFAVPTLHGEGIEHSHAGGDVEMGMEDGYNGYDGDVDSDPEISETGLEDIVQKQRYVTSGQSRSRLTSSPQTLRSSHTNSSGPGKHQPMAGANGTSGKLLSTVDGSRSSICKCFKK
jgi:hypothetical protein